MKNKITPPLDWQPMPKNLRLSVKREYFDQIKAGTKKREYRLTTEYWTKRLVGRDYDTVTITLGYPKRGDTEREITFQYNGYEAENIRHKHFGDEEVEVFAIILESSA